VLVGCRERPGSADGRTRPGERANSAAKHEVPASGPAVGQWTGELPAADAAARRFTLALGADYKAVLRTELADKGMMTEKGTWSADGRAITVMLVERDGKPTSTFLAYDLLADQLVPAAGWDSTRWGAAGPPKLAKQ
jgi:hypothetical protein